MPDAALDATAEALTRRILRDVPADQPRTRAHIAGLAAPVAALLEAWLDAHVDRAAAALDTPWVDASSDSVRDAVQAWRAAARAAAQFPATAWPEAVEQATRLALAHLVRPAETLAAYAFDGEDETLPSAIALRRIRAFGPYPYLPDIADRYADRKGLGRINRDGLERLLQRIDRRMVRAFGADDWLTLLGPLYTLVGPVASPPGTVPASILQALFRGRGADELASAIDEAEALTPEALHQRIADALPDLEPPAAPVLAEGGAIRAPEAPVFPAAPTEAEDETPPPPPVIGSAYRDTAQEPTDDSEGIGPARPARALADEEVPADLSEAEEASASFVFPEDVEDVGATESTAESATVAAAPAEEVVPPAPPAFEPSEPPAEAEDEPLWRRLARQQGVAPEVPATDARHTDEDDDAPLWKRFAQPATDAPPSTAPEAPEARKPASLHALEERVLGANADERRAWFINELFGGSADNYHQTLRALDDARTWTEATQIIARDVFRQHRVNIYSEPAIAFTDAVEARMARRG